jgi:hypothetical protein
MSIYTSSIEIGPENNNCEHKARHDCGNLHIAIPRYLVPFHLLLMHC